MLTPAQIADTLQVSPATVRRWSARFARHLTVLEQGEHLARRQELVGFSRGGDRKSDEFQTATVAVRKPTNELARAIGLSERSAHNRISVARALQYAQDLTAHLQSQLDEQTARLDALTAWLALPLYKRIGKRPPK